MCARACTRARTYYTYYTYYMARRCLVCLANHVIGTYYMGVWTYYIAHAAILVLFCLMADRLSANRRALSVYHLDIDVPAWYAVPWAIMADAGGWIRYRGTVSVAVSLG